MEKVSIVKGYGEFGYIAYLNVNIKLAIIPIQIEWQLSQIGYVGHVLIDALVVSANPLKRAISIYFNGSTVDTGSLDVEWLNEEQLEVSNSYYRQHPEVLEECEFLDKEQIAEILEGPVQKY